MFQLYITSEKVVLLDSSVQYSLILYACLCLGVAKSMIVLVITLSVASCRSQMNWILTRSLAQFE